MILTSVTFGSRLAIRMRIAITQRARMLASVRSRIGQTLVIHANRHLKTIAPKKKERAPRVTRNAKMVITESHVFAKVSVEMCHGLFVEANFVTAFLLLFRWIPSRK